MSTTGESSESSRTLPRAELNPLLNPILASHMGRWAEVYFTSPPEKREEAVLELLRELEAEDPGNQSAATKPEQESINATKLFRPAHGNGGSSASIEQNSVRCQRCGHDNPTPHQFCGMCGASLQASQINEFRPDSPYAQHEGEMESHEINPPLPAAEQAIPDSYESEEEPPARASRSDPYDLSLLQGLRQREIDDYEYQQPSAPRYRYYIGAVLAILLAVLGYTAWRSAQVSQNSHQASAPPPPAAVQSAPATQAPAPQASAPQATTTAPSTPEKATEPPVSPPGTNAAEGAKLKSESAVPPAVKSDQNPPSNTPSGTPAATEPQFTSTGGAEELAMAQHYLAGNNGQARDPAEASRWLWKAIAKHNGPASLQLADLYLKGDGVPKNCEQARILLDSAAIRGLKGAGERLRNLQAFGCQ